MISFDSPVYLGLLSFIPLGVYLHHFYRGRGGRISFPFTKWHGEAFTYPARVLKSVLFLAHLCFWGALSAIVIAIAGPVRVERETVYLNRGMDIMIVLDESPSMSARDFQPENRFEAAKEVIRAFVAGRPNDSVGLVSFSREAALRVPSTLDRSTLLERLDALRIMSLGDGTAIGLGISVAALHLERSGGTDQVILLITDGENNAGEILPETATDLAARLGIRIYAIGVGTQGEVPIEYTDPSTGVVRRGMFESRYNEPLLRQIAETTGGKYYAAKTPGALNAVFRSIDGIETSERRARIDVHTTPLYDRVVILALLLLLANFIIRSILLKEVLA
jgi:Ca-activated chloride channel family protein